MLLLFRVSVDLCTMYLVGSLILLSLMDFGNRDQLFAMADIVTPNLKEASALLGGASLKTVSDMRDAAKSIYNLGPR